jgi:hypothetical protein
VEHEEKAGRVVQCGSAAADVVFAVRRAVDDTVMLEMSGAAESVR